VSITGEIIGEPRGVNLYLRNDPRKNKVPIDGEIIFPNNGDNVYVSIDPTNLTQCEYSSVALSNLGSFVYGNLFNMKPGVSNEEIAEATNRTYIDCETNPEEMTIIVKAGNGTKVVREKNLCYVIYSTDCEIMPAVEKFMVESIVQTKQRKGL